MDGGWRKSGESDWEAGIVGVMELAVENGRIGSVGEWGYSRGDREDREMSRGEQGRLIEQVRQVAYRWHDHISLGLVRFM